MIARNCLSWLAAVRRRQLHAQGIYPGDAVRVNDETISYQRFQGFYVEYRNSKGVAVGARGDQLELLNKLRQRGDGSDSSSRRWSDRRPRRPASRRTRRRSTSTSRTALRLRQ